jgi:histidyl-tRNA synthetase
MTEDLTHAVSLASNMRRGGLRVLLDTEKRKFKAKLAYADKIDVPFVAFLGEDEISAGRVTVRDMRSGEQTTASAALILEGLREKLRAAEDIPPILDERDW